LRNLKIPERIKEILEADPKIGRYNLAQKANISESDARFYSKLYKFSDNKPIQRGIAVGDLHFPDHNPECLSILLQFIDDFKPDHLLLTGDMLDMASISSFNKKKPKLTEGKRLKREYKGFQKLVLDKIDSRVTDSCQKYFFVGNHEYRIDRLIEAEPQYEGFIELENNLNLNDYKIIPFNEVYNLGEMYFMHGDYYNKYHAEKNARIYGKHIFNWHVHTNQVYTMHSPINRLPRQGVSVGCMCNKNPEYMKNKPNHWVNQFMFFYLYGNGSFVYYTPIIINGRTIINGKEYKGC